MTDDPPANLGSSDSISPESRWRVLAGLRFSLAMIVVGWHLPWFSPPGSVTFFPELGGTAAVLGFLVISGYSIGHSLHRRPVGFFQRRLLRIYPLYIAAVFYSLIPFFSGADALGTRSPEEIFARPPAWMVVGNLLMLQNLLCPAIDSDLVVWTLGVEVACYLLAPLFRRMPTYFLLILIAISATAFAMYPRLHLRHYATLLWGLPLLMFAWAWIAGFLLHRHQTSVLIGVAIAGLGALLLHLNTAFPARYSIPTFVISGLIVSLSGRIPVPGIIGSLLNYLGDLSYPVYLFHLPTFLIGYCILETRSPIALVIMAITVSAAFLFIESILKPLLIRSKTLRPLTAEAAENSEKNSNIDRQDEQDRASCVGP